MTTKNITETLPDEILLKDISISPFNHRWGNRPIIEKPIEELAESIKTHGVIQAIMVRPLPNGKYEIVVGERRFRASKLAGKKTIPATIREMTDEKVQETQLIENFQREQPHPMAEAMGFKNLLGQNPRKNQIEELGASIGKPVAYVYQRLKLNDLIEGFQNIFFADKFTMSQALKVCRFDKLTQEEFFEDYCKNWEKKDWTISNFNYLVSNYQLDLKRAPFSIKDAKLDKAAGACTKCSMNTAFTKSLFPEDSKEARCTNRPCYENKCNLFSLLVIAEALAKHPELPITVPEPEEKGFLIGADHDLLKDRIVLQEGTDFNSFEDMPDMPMLDDFDYLDSEEEQEEELKDAIKEYEAEKQQLDDEVATGNYRIAIRIGGSKYARFVYLLPVKEGADPSKSNFNGALGQHNECKAKDYQEAVKNKTLNIEIVTNEKARLEARERRCKELDQEKLQLAFYEALNNHETALTPDHPAGKFYKAVNLFIVYNTLGYVGKEKLKKLIIDEKNPIQTEEEQLFNFFFNAADKQTALLARLAILNASDVKSPRSLSGQMLVKLVLGTQSIDEQLLVRDQQLITDERVAKLAEKLAILEKQAQKLEVKAA